MQFQTGSSGMTSDMTRTGNVFPTERNLYAGSIMRRAEEGNNKAIGGQRITNRRYADDTAILATSQKIIKY